MLWARGRRSALEQRAASSEAADAAGDHREFGREDASPDRQQWGGQGGHRPGDRMELNRHTRSETKLTIGPGF